MKKAVLYGCLLLAVTLFTGCTTDGIDGIDGNDGSEGNAERPVGEPGISGYVISTGGQRILVVSTQAKDFSSTGGVSEFYDAISFSNAPEGIKVGDKVNVWYDFVAQSYPGQSSALYVQVINAEKPEGAVLAESEALAKAFASNELESQETEFGDVYAVKVITYDSQAGSWDVQLKGIFSEQVYDIHIQDE